MTLLINPENHAEYSSAKNPTDYQYKRCMQAHLSLNTYLEEKIKQKCDTGAKYSGMLRSFCIVHENENGWWSLQAVDPENINYFIEFYTGNNDIFFDYHNFAIELIKQFKEKGINLDFRKMNMSQIVKTLGEL